MFNPVKPQELSSEERVNNFDEVVKGYNENEALEEAKRCLQCQDPKCISGCPVGINIKKFIGEIVRKDYKSAYFTILDKNNFPSICGRVCPAEYQCRKSCVLNKGKIYASPEVINIHFLERFVGDWGIKNGLLAREKKRASSTSKIVAVVGSGPAGLSAAANLSKEGIKVVVFESLHKIGGVLQYGIPSFRLPPDILNFEIERLINLGVEFKTNFVVGKNISLSDLLSQVDAVFLGVGAGIPVFLNIEGENLGNIYSANEFLTRVNLMKAHLFPTYHTPVNIGERVVVIGGGNTAIDAARVAVRLQKKEGYNINTRIVYRRTELEMPARRLEIDHAREEGVEFEFLLQPIRFVGNDDGYVEKVVCLRCELKEMDSSGRRSPVVIEGSEYNIDADLVIVAIGLRPNQLLLKTVPELRKDKYGNIIVDYESMGTSIKGVFAGGDIVGGEGTVIEAMGMGKRAADAIKKYLG